MPSKRRAQTTEARGWAFIRRTVATVYELCAGGGRAFIRRTVQLHSRPETHESQGLIDLSEWITTVPGMSSAQHQHPALPPAAAESPTSGDLIAVRIRSRHEGAGA